MKATIRMAMAATERKLTMKEMISPISGNSRSISRCSELPSTKKIRLPTQAKIKTMVYPAQIILRTI